MLLWQHGDVTMVTLVTMVTKVTMVKKLHCTSMYLKIRLTASGWHILCKSVLVR